MLKCIHLTISLALKLPLITDTIMLNEKLKKIITIKYNYFIEELRVTVAWNIKIDVLNKTNMKMVFKFTRHMLNLSNNFSYQPLKWSPFPSAYLFRCQYTDIMIISHFIAWKTVHLPSDLSVLFKRP